EELPWAIALQPLLQDPDVPGPAHLAHRDLMRAERPLRRLAVHGLRSGPTLRRAEDDHGPARTLPEALRPRFSLDSTDLDHDGVERRRHGLVHRGGIVTFHEVGEITEAVEERLQLRARNARKHRGPGDLVAVEVEDGQDRAVTSRVEELVGVPAGGERASLRLAIAHHAGDEES